MPGAGVRYFNTPMLGSPEFEDEDSLPDVAPRFALPPRSKSASQARHAPQEKRRRSREDDFEAPNDWKL
jgi:hypothetical protein